VIPAFNEEENITGVIRGIRQVLGDEVEILVVDDASTDRTGEIARQCGAEVIRHPYRKGNGAAVKTGIRHVTGDITVLMDADGQHPPDRIPELLDHMDMHEMVIGARTNIARISYLRYCGNRIFNMLASYVTGMKIHDLTSGFRAIETRILFQYLYLLPNSYSYPTTITLAMIKAGYSVAFVPFDCHERKGTSKLHPFRDGIRFFGILLKVSTLYSPLKIFAPVSAAFILVGVGWYLYIISHVSRLPKISVLLVSIGTAVFLMGLIAEQVSLLRMDPRD